MTLQEFINKWNGKGCDYDGSYGNQCVDLYRMYVKEVLGFPQTPPVVGAKDIWTSVTDNFEKIPQTPEGVPQVGDVMIWGPKYGQFGHVAIVTQADVNKFTCFSQNDPQGALCGLKTYTNWSSLLGWLRPKKVEDNNYKGYDLTNKDSMKVAVDALTDLISGDLVRKVEVENLTKKIGDLESNLKSLDDRLASLEGTIKTKDEELVLSTQQVGVLKEEIQKLQADIDYYKPYKSRYEEALTKVPNSMTGLQLIKLGLKKLSSKK